MSILIGSQNELIRYAAEVQSLRWVQTSDDDNCSFHTLPIILIKTLIISKRTSGYRAWRSPGQQWPGNTWSELSSDSQHYVPDTPRPAYIYICKAGRRRHSHSAVARKSSHRSHVQQVQGSSAQLTYRYERFSTVLLYMNTFVSILVHHFARTHCAVLHCTVTGPMAATFKLTYFNMKGRGELIRLTFAVAGVPFEDNRLNPSDWPKLKASMSRTQFTHPLKSGWTGRSHCIHVVRTFLQRCRSASCQFSKWAASGSRRPAQSCCSSHVNSVRTFPYRRLTSHLLKIGYTSV